MLTAAFLVAAALYLTASIWFVRGFVGARPDEPRHALLIGAVLAHTIAVILYAARYGDLPLVGLGPSLATLSLLIGLSVLGLHLRGGARALGLMLAPVAFVLLATGLIVGIRPAGSLTTFRGTWLALHVSLSFAGYALWFVAAASSLMYLLQFRELKHKQLGSVFRFFPALETLDNLGRGAISGGFFALTLGVVLGLAWMMRFAPEAALENPKVVWGVTSWGVMLVALIARAGRWPSRRAAMWSFGGLTFMFFAYLVVKMMVPNTRLFL